MLFRSSTDPTAVQQPHPIVMSAGFSPKGRDFAAITSRALFTTMSDLSQAPKMMADIKALVARHGRQLDVYTMAHVVCRPTRKEAEEFYFYFAEEMADADGQAYYRRQRGSKAGTMSGPKIERPLENRYMRASGKKLDGAYPGAYPLIGSPDDVAEEIARLSAAGLAGCSIAFLDYLKEIPFFVAEVLPRLERMGLRRPATA